VKVPVRADQAGPIILHLPEKVPDLRGKVQDQRESHTPHHQLHLTHHPEAVKAVRAVETLAAEAMAVAAVQADHQEGEDNLI